jgi:hypothetical protein
LSKIFQVALGIVAAVGGFVDIGELVFNTQAGASYRFQLLWAVVVGVVGIVVYAEMSGRVAAVCQRPVFDVVRMRMGLSAAWSPSSRRSSSTCSPSPPSSAAPRSYCASCSISARRPSCSSRSWPCS